MRLFSVIVLILCFGSSAFSQRRFGNFIRPRGLFLPLAIDQVILPREVRTLNIYHFPHFLPYFYRLGLASQISPAYRHTDDRALIENERHPPEGEFEAFFVPENIRQNPEQILELTQPINELAYYGMGVSDPNLSPINICIAARNLAIRAFGALANLHIEAAYAMQNNPTRYTQEQINEQLREAHRVLNIQQKAAELLMAQFNVPSPDLLIAIQDQREELGEIPPSAPENPPNQTNPTRRRFWQGVPNPFRTPTSPS